MAAALSLNQNVLPNPIDRTQQSVMVYGSIVLTGNYGVANGHGDILAFGGLGIPSDAIPSTVEIYEEPTAGNGPTGFAFIYARGVDQNSGKLVVTQNSAGSAPNAELTQGNAYPAGLLAAAANLKFIAYFPKFL